MVLSLVNGFNVIFRSIQFSSRDTKLTCIENISNDCRFLNILNSFREFFNILTVKPY